jgi:DNA-binding beta-propeller fold protein YncE
MHLFVPANELFVADGYGNHQLRCSTPPPASSNVWGANGGTPFNIVHSIRVSNDGLVYVADRGNKRVQVFTTAGEFKQDLPSERGTRPCRRRPGWPSRRTASSASSTSPPGNNQIVIVDRKTMTIAGSFGKSGTNPGEFGTVHEIATDSKGNLYSAELRTKRVQKFVFKGSLNRLGLEARVRGWRSWGRGGGRRQAG